MRILPLLAGGLMTASLACAQTTVLYEQNWGTGNGSPSLADLGWSQILVPAGYSGTYQEATAHDGDTAEPLPANTLYFGGNAGIGFFYTTDGAGSGTSGNSAFTSIDPTPHTNLNLTVECQWSYQGANLTCWFAVQVGGSWYVATNAPLVTAQHSAGPTFHRSGITYNPASTNWNVLTISPALEIGGPAAANLAGDITGIGIVARLTGPGSWDYNLLQVTSVSNTMTLPPTLSAAPISQTEYEGGGVSFAVRATGSEPFTYTWFKDGMEISNGDRFSGADTARLTISNIENGDIGTYSVIVSNSAGSFDTALTEPALLIVNPVPADYLYAENFPFVGALPVGYPISIVGWSNAISGNLDRLYQAGGGDGAAFAFESAASTKAFYVTTNSDTGFSGLPFRKITPSNHPAVSFSVDIAPSFQPANVSAYVAVQMNGSDWFVNVTALPVDTSTATGTFTTYRQQFDPLADQWNTLTIEASGATVGGPAQANLTGDITGAGLVFVYTGSGNFNIDNFLVTTNEVPPSPPLLTFSPLSQTVYVGAGVSFAVNASGTRPFGYFWDKDFVTVNDDARISGAHSNRLNILNVNMTDAGMYSVTVSNSAGIDSSFNYVTTVLTVNERPADLLYLETFPFVGPGSGTFPLSVVGWENAIPNTPSRLFQIAGGDGAAFAFQGAPATTAFFTSTTLDPGTSGLPFPNDLFPSAAQDLAFSVDIAPSTTPQGITAAFAVQMNGNGWYVSAQNLPVDTSVENPEYATYTQPIDLSANQWRELTLTAGSGATIGELVSAPLTGQITGAGLVFTHTSSGTFNFDNFRITGTLIGAVNVQSWNGNSLTISWRGQPGVRLMSTTNMTPPVIWTEVPNTLGESTVTIPLTGDGRYFRLSSE